MQETRQLIVRINKVTNSIALLDYREVMLSKFSTKWASRFHVRLLFSVSLSFQMTILIDKQQ